MKQQSITFILTMLISMMGVEALAYDIGVANSDGVTIYYKYQNNNTELAVSYHGKGISDVIIDNSNRYSGNVTIPESVTYNGRTYSVTSINEYAFYGCSDLTSVIIPNSITSIGDYAFRNCSGLTSVTIPNSVISIGSQAFYYTGIYNNSPDGILYVDKWICGYKGETYCN